MQIKGRFGISLMRQLALASLAVMVGFACVTVSGAAASSNPAEKYIDSNVQHGLGILKDKSLSTEQRRDQFQQFLTSLTDLKAIADYTLGQYRRGADKSLVAEFEGAYKEYALAVYRTYFSKFSGQSLKVVGSYKFGAQDTVVKTVLVHADGSVGNKPIRIYFRVHDQGGTLSVIDMSLEGVWLRQTQRDDFTSYLGQHSGDIKSLISVLKKKTAAEVARIKAEK